MEAQNSKQDLGKLHGEVREMISTIAFCETEARFFDKVLRSKTLNTGSQYGDRVAGSIQERVTWLISDLKKLEEMLNGFDNQIGSTLEAGTLMTEDQQKTYETLIDKYNDSIREIKKIKKDLFDFADSYGLENE